MVKKKSQKNDANSKIVWVIIFIVVITLVAFLLLKSTSFQQSPQFSPTTTETQPFSTSEDNPSPSPSGTTSPTPEGCYIKIPKAECKGTFTKTNANANIADLQALNECLQHGFNCKANQALEPVEAAVECLQSGEKSGKECTFSKGTAVNTQCVKVGCVPAGEASTKCTYRYEYDEGPDDLTAKTSGYKCEEAQNI